MAVRWAWCGSCPCFASPCASILLHMVYIICPYYSLRCVPSFMTALSASSMLTADDSRPDSHVLRMRSYSS